MNKTYEAYTFNDGTGAKTIHCTDHGYPNKHTNPHIHDEPDAGISVFDDGVYYRGMRVAFVASCPNEGGHGKSRDLTPYERELLAAMRE